MISRETARAIADRDATVHRLGFGIARVVAPAEMRHGPLSLYLANGLLDNCWIAYVNDGHTGLRASTIVVIDRETGDVVYRGSANDEG